MSNSGSSDGEGRQDDGEFCVESIVRREKYDNLLEIYREFKNAYNFQPHCLREEVHSKYCYLVKWKGYDEEEKTWEPESNLLDNACLARFKEDGGFSSNHKIFRKIYDEKRATKSKTPEEKKEKKKTTTKKKSKKRRSSTGASSNGDFGQLETADVKQEADEEVASPEKTEKDAKENFVPYPTSLEMYNALSESTKLRRCISAERLNETWEKKLTTHLISALIDKSLNKSCDPSKGAEASVLGSPKLGSPPGISVILQGFWKSKFESSLESKKKCVKNEEDAKARFVESLLERNFVAIVKLFPSMEEHTKESLKRMIGFYTKSNISAVQHFLARISDETFRFNLISALVMHANVLCSTDANQKRSERGKSWSLARRSLERLILRPLLRYLLTLAPDLDAEADSDSTAPSSSAFVRCSKTHWKCGMLSVLLKYSPAEKFLRKSSPFSIKSFMYCMSFGALCQQLEFIKDGVPFNHEFRCVTKTDGFLVDHVQLAASRLNSTHFFFSFFTFGFDPSSFAQVESSSELVMIEDYVAGRAKACKESTSKTLCESKKDYCSILTCMLQRFRALLQGNVDGKVQKDILIAHQMKLQLVGHVTPPHVICVSGSNGKKSGVFTCLFWELGVRHASECNIPLAVVQQVDTVRESMAAKKSCLLVCVAPVDIQNCSDGADDIPSVILLNETSNTIDVSIVTHNGANDGQRISTKEYMTTSESKGCRYFILDSSEKGLENLQGGLATLTIECDAAAPKLFLVQIVHLRRFDANNNALKC